jgi:hypothetical protein
MINATMREKVVSRIVDGPSEVSLERPEKPPRVLLRERSVQPHDVSHPGDVVRRGVCAGHDGRGISGDQVDEEEHDAHDHEHHGKEIEQSSGKIGPHVFAASLRAGLGPAGRSETRPPDARRYFSNQAFQRNARFMLV